MPDVDDEMGWDGLLFVGGGGRRMENQEEEGVRAGRESKNQTLHFMGYSIYATTAYQRVVLMVVVYCCVASSKQV